MKNKYILDVISSICMLGGCIIWTIGMSKKTTDIDLSDELRSYGMLLILISGIINFCLRFIEKRANKRIHRDINILK